MPTRNQPEPLILASTSPRRARLLREAGYRFDTAAPSFEEPDDGHQDVGPAAHAEALAYFKAMSVADRHPGAVILAADTITVFGNEVYGKPADRDDARRILQCLSNSTHEVMTGVALLRGVTPLRLIRHDVTTVRVRPLSDEMLEAYLDTGQWRGKAGAYGIQDQDDPFVERIEGSFSNVVGLPLELVAEMFREWMQMSAAG